MRNPAWYEDALGLEHQVHCYLGDETGARCYLHVKSSGVFESLDRINSRQLEQPEELEKWIDSVLSHDMCRGAKSLGMIFYLADEFSLAGLGPEYKNPGELAALRDKMGYAPREVLDDKTKYPVTLEEAYEVLSLYDQEFKKKPGKKDDDDDEGLRLASFAQKGERVCHFCGHKGHLQVDCDFYKSAKADVALIGPNSATV